MNLQKAFSLWEVLCVLLIFSLLAASNATSSVLSYYHSWSDRQQLHQANRQLQTAIATSRSLAIRSDSPVQLCGGVSCNGRWSDGISLLQSGHSTPYQTWAFPELIDLVWRGFPARKTAISFLPTGISNFQNGSFYFCFKGIQQVRVVINKAGRAYEDPAFIAGGAC
ncbi:GspH/FimT family pseudopilin [Marinomonas mediterranea]|uniref:GspH/FimT family pseudopilin n=1 Tax=Marinomonas mediterranea TaxID=119864 RepID=UPI0023498CCB|nr:GspH/FimT family pseudopilin [Marinomonas mediterranea]WCN10247.1 prepilin-type N-terminal cleavage/methylation domain-containing protein [Marinomonas mediterranea]